MTGRPSIYEDLQAQGVSRRGLLKFCGYMSSLMALPAGSAQAIAQALSTKPRPSVIWELGERVIEELEQDPLPRIC